MEGAKYESHFGQSVYGVIIGDNPTVTNIYQSVSSASSYRSILGVPPLTDPHATQQRISLVDAIYTELTQLNLNALVLTGIGGIGKTTLASLVYKFVEDQQQTGSWFAHFWTRFSLLWCSSGDDSSILKRSKNNCFTEKCPYSLKALKAFSVKTVVPLPISRCQKSVGNDPYLIQFLRHFLASSGEYNSFYVPKNERTLE